MALHSSAELVTQLTDKTLDDLAAAYEAAAERVSTNPDGSRFSPDPKDLIVAQMEVLMSFIVANLEIKGVNAALDDGTPITTGPNTGGHTGRPLEL